MRRIVFWLIALSLFAPKAAFPAKAGVLAVKSALVMDYGTGKVLFEQDSDRLIPPASVTKIMTMYIVFDELTAGRARLSDPVMVSSRADATGGSTMHIKAGEVLPLEELMRGMAVASGNDACIAVAEHFGGVPRFVDRMNQKARELGMTSTTFKNPNGLPAEGQYTTARDLMKLATSYLRHYPQALRYHSQTEITHDGFTRHNSNRMLGVVEGVDGIKTGFVGASGYNIVATAKRGNTRLIAVVLGGRSHQIRDREAARVLDASFAGEGVPPTMLASADETPHRRHHQAKEATVEKRSRHGKNSVIASRSRHEGKRQTLHISSRSTKSRIEAVDMGAKGDRRKVAVSRAEPKKSTAKHPRRHSRHYDMAEAR